jgi:hypothetical protein
MADIEYAVVLFHSTQGAIKAERVLVRGGFSSIKLIPTPRELSSDCGTALRCAWADIEAVIAVLQAAHVKYDSVHKVNARG